MADVRRRDFLGILAASLSASRLAHVAGRDRPPLEAHLTSIRIRLGVDNRAAGLVKRVS